MEVQCKLTDMFIDLYLFRLSQKMLHIQCNMTSQITEYSNGEFLRKEFFFLVYDLSNVNFDLKNEIVH